MAQQKLWYLVSYDVRDSKRLKKVAKHLEGYGHRIQYSIFRCRMSDRQMERLRWELKKLMKKEDDLIIVGLCAACLGKIYASGREEEWSTEIQRYKIV